MIKRFAIKLGEGRVIGVYDTKQGPCPKCYLNYLKDRKVQAKIDKPLDKDSPMYERLKKMTQHNILYEITSTNQINTLTLYTYKHENCPSKRCQNGMEANFKYTDWNNLNCAFSNIYQIKCIRFGTPSGNVWKFSATIHQGGKIINRIVSHKDKETARRMVILGETHGHEGQPEEMPQMGVQIVDNAKKTPTLIVGANPWIRRRVPYFVLQQYDLYLLQMPTDDGSYRIVIGAFSRTNSSRYEWAYADSNSAVKAAESALYNLLNRLKPSDWRMEEVKETGHDKTLALWNTNFVYRCPKVAMKDIFNKVDKEDKRVMAG